MGVGGWLMVMVVIKSPNAHYKSFKKRKTLGHNAKLPFPAVENEKILNGIPNSPWRYIDEHKKCAILLKYRQNER